MPLAISRPARSVARCLVLALAVLGVASFAGCEDDPLPSGLGGGGSGAGGPYSLEWPNVTCDPLVPEVCAYPFPSDVFTALDDTTPTGRRVSLLDGTLPVSTTEYEPSGRPWDKSDGFSPGMSILSYFPGASGKGLASQLEIAKSLDRDSRTVLLDTKTLEWVPHFAELDSSGRDPEKRALLIHPAVRLEDARRYIVAIRGLVDADDQPIEPSPAFKALRDGEAFDEDDSIDRRRGLYEDIFGVLESAGVGKDDLLLAWDYTTASRESTTGWMVHMRDEALEAAGDDGPAYTITSTEDDYNPTEIAFRVQGTMTVPLYLDQKGPGAALHFGDDGKPEPNPKKPTYEVPWELLIPQSALTEKAKLLQYGHGLLGSYGQIEATHFATFMNTYNYAMFAVNLDGMASDDQGWIAQQVGDAKVDVLTHMFDRMHQGVLNNLLAMRMVSRGLTKDADLGQYLDKNQRFYYGISQGGIFGGVYMALTTDVTRGVMEVMGQPYDLVLNRSADFGPFFIFLALALPDSRDQQTFLGVTQMAWDRVEPNGYTKYIVEDRLPGTPPHQVLMRSAIGDHQVTTLGAQVMARATKAVHLDTGIRDVYGLEKKKGPFEAGATYVEYGFGLPDEPVCNKPMTLCNDPHGELRELEAARQQLDHFLRTGEAKSFCTEGPNGDDCNYRKLSGCEGDEDPGATCE